VRGPLLAGLPLVWLHLLMEKTARISEGRARQGLLTLLSDGVLIATTIAALVLSFFWFMSPLGLGFAEQSVDPTRKQWADGIYRLSYYLGIPMLLIGQAFAVICHVRGHCRRGLIISALIIVAFVLCAALALGLRR
jgi:vacuolar-type H+-ATPase subunit I/STV1